MKAILCFAFALIASTGLPNKYTIQELPMLAGGMGSWPKDINNRGQVVGFTADGTGEYRAVIWDSRGNVTNLGGTAALSSKALGISEGGLVVGSFDVQGGYAQAVYWKNGSPVFLGMLQGHIGSVAYDANDEGVIVGISYNWAGDSTPVMWIDGVIQQVGPSHAWVSGLSAGGVAGGRINVTSWPQPVLFTTTSMTLLPNLGAEEGYVYDLNEQGVAVGIAVSPVDGFYHAVFWREGEIEDKGLIIQGSRGTQAYGINGREDFVGQYFPPTGNYRSFAMVGGRPIDLDSSVLNLNTWTMNAVYDINDAGVIIGEGYAGGGMWYERAFVLRPTNGAR